MVTALFRQSGHRLGIPPQLVHRGIHHCPTTRGPELLQVSCSSLVVDAQIRVVASQGREEGVLMTACWPQSDRVEVTTDRTPQAAEAKRQPQRMLCATPA